MPVLHGIRFVWRTASRLQPGDELLPDIGPSMYVSAAYHDPDGTWIEFSDGDGVIDAGYATGRYRVIT